MQDGEVWLTQDGIAQLFDVDRSVVTKHLKNFFQDGELAEKETRAKFTQVADNGKPYLDHATRRARRHIPMTMEDWASKLDAFLQFNDAEILQDKGKVTAAIAKAFAESEFEKYRVIQDRLYESDFDRFLMLEQEVNHKDEV